MYPSNKKFKTKVQVVSPGSSYSISSNSNHRSTTTSSDDGGGSSRRSYQQMMNDRYCYSINTLNQDFLSDMTAIQQQYCKTNNHHQKNHTTTNKPSSSSMDLYRFFVDEYIRMVQFIHQQYNIFEMHHTTTYGMGSNESDQLGPITQPIHHQQNHSRPNIVPSPIPIPISIRMICAGGLHSVVLSTTGIPYSWGCNDDGTLGRITTNTEQEQSPLPITNFIRYNNNSMNHNINHNNQSTICEDGQMIQIAAGESHTLFLSITGHVFQCGMYKDTDSGKFHDIDPMSSNNKSSPLGNNLQPVHVHQIPGFVISIYTCGGYNVALLQDHTIVTWGFGNSGELARSANMTTPNANGSYDVGKSFMFKSIIDKDGNPMDVPDINVIKEHFLKPKPVVWDPPLPIKRTVIDVGCGSNHLLVVARDPGSNHSKVYSSGLNNYGQLGHGDAGEGTERHALTLIEAVKDLSFGQVAGGAHFSLILSHDRRYLYSFGRADYGQLGIGVIKDAGDYRATPQLVKFPEIVKLRKIDAGDLHSMALTDDYKLYTWGFNEEGTTGHQDKNDIYRPRLLDINTGSEKVRIIGMSGGGQHSLLHVQNILE